MKTKLYGLLAVFILLPNQIALASHPANTTTKKDESVDKAKPFLVTQAQRPVHRAVEQRWSKQVTPNSKDKACVGCNFDTGAFNINSPSRRNPHPSAFSGTWSRTNDPHLNNLSFDTINSSIREWFTSSQGEATMKAVMSGFGNYTIHRDRF
ncbi:hypothetical protein [Scytonema millei]|uniref:Uncharacterized protein n=1 Tax=Scytonema millei VB511283 TaxID=1245923 RepID=A0A9X5E5X7_9CYAN|nr:hypothetical protein [Scytonema millei]NHC35960.1 hypothetical protein [Scytonema millei VB511283]